MQFICFVLADVCLSSSFIHDIDVHIASVRHYCHAHSLVGCCAGSLSTFIRPCVLSLLCVVAACPQINTQHEWHKRSLTNKQVKFLPPFNVNDCMFLLQRNSAFFVSPRCCHLPWSPIDALVTPSDNMRVPHAGIRCIIPIPGRRQLFLVNCYLPHMQCTSRH
jgi:hypothetical protein